MITIRFVTGGDPVSDGIRAFEYGFWATHTEALMPDGSLLGAHAKGGVLARDHDYDKSEFTRELYVAIPSTPEQADAFYSYLREQVGKPYDFLAIAGIALRRDWRSENSWFCSELIASALSQANVHVFPSHLAEDFNHVTPRDVLLIVSGRLDLAIVALTEPVKMAIAAIEPVQAAIATLTDPVQGASK
jgi:hypothetical protein